jgi:hypothetical protein
MWKLGPEERLVAPEEFQQRLTDAGGVNRYDEPNFRIAWGQTETIRTAGWDGYKDTLIAFNDPSWQLMQWVAPELLGTPESWYVTNHDEATGFCLMGEYPYSGNYKILFNLSHRYVENNEMKIFRFPLSDKLLSAVVPLVMQAKDITIEQNKAAWEAQEYQKDYDLELMVENIRKSKKLAFKGGSISYANQGIRTSVIDQKTQQLSLGWAAAAAKLKAHGLGAHQGDL